MSAALTRYRILAYATGVLLLLLTFNVIVKYGFDQAGIGAWVAITHGWLYLAYVLVTADLWFRTRLPLPQTGLVVLAGTVPAMSFVAERWITRRVRPMIAAEARREGLESAGRLGA
jgi:integral membrane protein